jgi:hypothetical protein
VNCPPPQVTVTINGDEKLYAVFLAREGDIGTAINLTVALKNPIANIAGKTVAVFQAIGDIGASGASCVASTLSVAAHAQASISVSVSASATVSGSSG